MPGYLFSNSLLMLERAMDYQWTKFSVISDNIVNAETPNYKPKYVTFEEALSASIRSSVRNTDRKGASVRSAILRSQPIVHVAEEESMRMDDNGVNVGEQLVEATRNTYQIQYVMDSMNSDLTRLRAAIRGQ